MSTPIITIAGMYRYNSHVFDNWEIPESIDRESVLNNVLLECCNLPLLYTDYDILVAAIAAWSAGMQYRWKTLVNTTNQEYNPIENYNRIEEYTNTDKGTVTSDGTSTGAATAFNSDELKTTGQTKNGGTNTQDLTHTTSGKMHGNIGVTTTQKMLTEERRISDFSLIDMLTQDFKNRFCLLVY